MALTGGVVDGTPVDAATTNPAFLDANGDDTGIGVYTLANVDTPASGPQIDNIQREHNSIASFVGKAINALYNALPTWTPVAGFLSTDNLFARLDFITGKFHATTGHAHTGAAGDGPPISSAGVGGVPLRGYDYATTNLTGVTGSSSNVSTQLTGVVESSGPTVEGAVTTVPHNLVLLRQASGTSAGQAFSDTNGNTVYGRLTKSGAVWTLSYYSLVSGTETAYSFASSTSIIWYLQYLYNPIVDGPVYNDLFFTLGSGGGGGGAPVSTFFKQETPTGTINGSNVNFTLSLTPVDPADVVVFVDDVPQVYGTNFTVSGSTITMAVAPAFGQYVYSFYFVNPAAVPGSGGALVVSGTVASPITITTSGITASVSQRQAQIVVSSGGAVTVTANPQISAGTVLGQEMILTGTSDTNYPILNDGTGLALNGSMSLKNNSTIYLFWNGVVWAEISRR